jgi:hypothetical protein
MKKLLFFLLSMFSLTVFGQVNLQYGTIWDDLRFPANAFNPPGLVADPDWVNVWGGLYLLGFNGGTDESVFIVAQFPHTWDSGSSIIPHVHTTQGNATDNKTVIWGLEYSWANMETNYNPTTTTIYVTNTLDGVAYQHNYIEFAPIVATGKEDSSCMIIRLFRDADVDTSTADIYMIEFDIHYQVGKLGELL